MQYEPVPGKVLCRIIPQERSDGTYAVRESLAPRFAEIVKIGRRPLMERIANLFQNPVVREGRKIVIPNTRHVHEDMLVVNYDDIWLCI